MHFLVNHVQTRIQNELVSRLYKRELWDKLLAEDPLVATQRARAAEMLAALQRASLIVAEVGRVLVVLHSHLSLIMQLLSFFSLSLGT